MVGFEGENFGDECLGKGGNREKREKKKEKYSGRDKPSRYLLNILILFSANSNFAFQHYQGFKPILSIPCNSSPYGIKYGITNWMS